MLRPAVKDDLGAAAADPGITRILESLPTAGFVSADRLQGERHTVERAIQWACSRGIMQKTGLGGRVMDLESARFWIGQLGKSRMKNVNGNGGTRRAYVEELESFNEWLRGAEFPAGHGGPFADVEALLRFCEAGGAHAARRAIRQYMSESAGAGYSINTAILRCSAIKSYFAAHDIPVSLRVDKRRYATHDVRDDSEMTLMDFYKMVTAGGTDAMARAVMMAKFQAGLDSSTMADRFNFEAYPQMTKYFGADDHAAWDLGRCPVPIRLVRVKTGMQYTTFLDRDAVSCLQDYLGWKKEARGREQGGDDPMFETRRGTPVSSNWVSAKFSTAAMNAGIQRKVTPRMYKIRSHEVRDLLKSTLIASGCAAYVADHVLGHSPRDSYEKQAALYPETLRSEYAKASWRINVFSSFERHLDSAAALPRTGRDRTGPAAGAEGEGPRPEGAYAGSRMPDAQALLLQQMQQQMQQQQQMQMQMQQQMQQQQQAMQSEIQKMRRDMAYAAGVRRAGKNTDPMPDGAARRLQDLPEDDSDGGTTA